MLEQLNRCTSLHVTQACKPIWMHPFRPGTSKGSETLQGSGIICQDPLVTEIPFPCLHSYIMLPSWAGCFFHKPRFSLQLFNLRDILSDNIYIYTKLYKHISTYRNKGVVESSPSYFAPTPYLGLLLYRHVAQLLKSQGWKEHERTGCSHMGVPKVDSKTAQNRG